MLAGTAMLAMGIPGPLEQLVSPAAATAWTPLPEEHQPTIHDAFPVIGVDVNALLAETMQGQGYLDTGCSSSVAGSGWIAAMAQELAARGLEMEKGETNEVFRGLGGATRRAKTRWTFPVGIKGRNSTITVAEVDGDMPLLISIGQMAEWGFQQLFEGRPG